MQGICRNNLNADLRSCPVTPVTSVLLQGGESLGLTASQEGLEKSYAKMGRTRNLLQAKSRIVEHLKKKIKTSKKEAKQRNIQKLKIVRSIKHGQFHCENTTCTKNINTEAKPRTQAVLPNQAKQKQIANMA